MNTICINENQKATIINILKKYFQNEKFFVFGSRATNKNLKKFSDLDIAIVGNSKIDKSILDRIFEEFSASDLPFKVDLIDINSVTSEFKKNVEPDFIELK